LHSYHNILSDLNVLLIRLELKVVEGTLNIFLEIEEVSSYINFTRFSTKTKEMYVCNNFGLVKGGRDGK